MWLVDRVIMSGFTDEELRVVCQGGMDLGMEGYRNEGNKRGRLSALSLLSAGVG